MSSATSFKIINKNIIMLLTFVITIFLLQFQVSNKRITNKTYVTGQYYKPCVAKSYKPSNILENKILLKTY